VANETKKSTILDTAVEIVNGDRSRFYGHPLDNHGNTAEMWSSWLRRRFRLTVEQLDLKAEDVCWLMVLLKASREANMHHDDNEVDGVGYLLNAEMSRAERALREPQAKAQAQGDHPLNRVAPVAKLLLCPCVTCQLKRAREQEVVFVS
jgi:hypothetical protein